MHASTDAHEKRGQQFVTREDFCGQGGLTRLQGLADQKQQGHQGSQYLRRLAVVLSEVVRKDFWD